MRFFHSWYDLILASRAPHQRYIQEVYEDGEYIEPAGIHLVPYPYADDIRAAPITEQYRGGYL